MVGIPNTGESSKRFPEADLLRLSENDVGRKFSGEMLCERMLVEETKNGAFYLLYIEAQTDDDNEYVFVGFDVPNGKVASFKSPEIVGDYARISYCGVVREKGARDIRRRRFSRNDRFFRAEYRKAQNDGKR